MLSQKRVELSALTWEGEQSAKGCSERGCQHPLPPNTGERGAWGFCGDLPSGFSWQCPEALIRAGHPHLASPW